MGRRQALAGIGLMLASPARAKLSERLRDAAAGTLAEGGPPVDLDRHSVMLAPWPGGPRAGLLVAAAVAKGGVTASGATPNLLRAAILERNGEGLRVLARGEADALANEPLWSLTLDLDRRRWPLPGGTPAVGVVLSNAYISTWRTSDTTALHLFRWQGMTLQPVFVALTERYDHTDDRDKACQTRRGDARGKRRVLERAANACGRLHDHLEEWSVAAVTMHPAGPSLIVRNRQGRIVSRHRWSGAAFTPPRFLPQDVPG